MPCSADVGGDRSQNGGKATSIGCDFSTERHGALSGALRGFAPFGLRLSRPECCVGSPWSSSLTIAMVMCSCFAHLAMTRRSAPQKQIDDRSFPVRVGLQMPKDGFGTSYNLIQDWLMKEVGRSEHAWHPWSATGREAVAVYFRSVEAALAFVWAFPELRLADGTESPGYQSPALPFGRHGPVKR
jgi:hypothetical protein